MRLKMLTLSGAAALLAALPALAQMPSGGTAMPAVATTDADALADTVRRVASNPLDLNALLTAGELSVKLGDLSAGGAFFARAEKIDPRNARAQAGKASILVRSERPGEAMRYFAQAEALGLEPRRFAADRGLAYDLLGDQPRAQRDYRIALADRADDETRRRLALSLAISGRADDALRELAPLLRENDRAAWRTRAFVEAMRGNAEEASRIATTMMPPGTAAGLATFFARLPTLPAIDRAFAVHFGEVHATPERLADARLAPVTTPLPAEPVRVQVAAVVAPPPVDRRERRRRAKVGRQAMASTVPAAPVLAAADGPGEPPAFRAPAAQVSVAAASPYPRSYMAPAAHALTADEMASLAAATTPSRRGRHDRTEPAAARVEVASLDRSASSSTTATSRVTEPVPIRAASAAIVVAAQPTPVPGRVSAFTEARPPAAPAPAATLAGTILPGALAPLTVAAADTAPLRTGLIASQPTSGVMSTGVAAPAPQSLPAGPPASALVAASNPTIVTAVAPVSVLGSLSSSSATTVGGSVATQVVPATGLPAAAGGTALPVSTVEAGPPIEVAAVPPASMPATLPQPGFTSDRPVAATALAPLVTSPMPASVATSPRPARASRPTGRPPRVEADSILARIVAGLTIPASELGVGGTPSRAAASVGRGVEVTTDRAVDTRAAAERKAMPGRTRGTNVADRDPVGRGSEKNVAKTAADRKAAAKQALVDKEEDDARKLAKANPPRIWVQVAGGANESDLPKAWAAARKKAPNTLGARAGYATPLRATNRVLTGPFKTDAEARAAVNQLAKEGLSAFAFTSEAGQPVTKLGQR